MKNVGDDVTLGISAISSAGSNIYSYAWRLWDGSSTATTVPSLTTSVNIGGNPQDNRLLDYDIVPVATDGSYVVINGSFQANNPPYVVPSPTISQNDTFFPYQTQLEVVVYDLENDPFNVSWFQGDVFLGNGTLAFVGTHVGTWSGNGTTIFPDVLTYTNGTSIRITSQRTVTCVISDDQNGTTMIDFDLRGVPRPAPSAGITAEVSTLTADPSSLPVAKIGPGQSVDFEVYARDITGSDLTFLWDFDIDHNWTVETTVSGTTTPTVDGGFRNNTTKDISGEVVIDGTQKIATALCQVTGPTTASIVRIDVTLIANNPPTDVTFDVKVGGASIDISNSFPAGTMLEFNATPIDPDNDVCIFKWTFSQTFDPTTLVAYGPKIYLDTTDYNPGFTSGQLVCTDEAGDTLTVAIPSIEIT